MAKIDHANQPELPIAQRITCRRCKGVGTVYYIRTLAKVVGESGLAARSAKDSEVSTLRISYSDTLPYPKTKRGAKDDGSMLATFLSFCYKPVFVAGPRAVSGRPCGVRTI